MANRCPDPTTTGTATTITRMASRRERYTRTPTLRGYASAGTPTAKTFTTGTTDDLP